MQHRSGRRRAASALLSSALVCACLHTIATAPPAAATTTIHVPADQPTISAALAAAVDGDTIEVAPGTYHEHLDFTGKDVSLVSSGGPDATTIDADSTGIAGRIGPGGRIEGFTIREGKSDFGTGGIVVVGDGPVIRGNHFTGNQSDPGSSAAIHSRDNDLVIDRNRFTANTCGGVGGGNAGAIYVGGQATVTVTNNVFVDNSCGAALNMSLGITGLMAATNNTVVGSYIGLRVNTTYAEEPHVIRNNILVGNTIGLEMSTDPMPVDHNVFWDNGTDWKESPSQIGSDGNVRIDPLFIDQEGRDLRLQGTSPAVDTGNADGAPTVDHLGVARPLDGPDADSDAAVDIGAYERSGTEPPPVPQLDRLDTTWSQDGIAPLQTKYEAALGATGSGRLDVGLYKDGDGQGRFRLWSYDSLGHPSQTFAHGYVLGSFASGGVSFPQEVDPWVTRKVVVGSWNSSSLARMGVARFLSTGAYDTSLSADGRALYKVFALEHDYIEPFRAQVLSGGKIGVAVAAFDYNSKGQLVYVGQAVVRLNANGSLDTTLSSDGVLPIAKDVGDVHFLADGRMYMDRQVGTSHEVRKFRANGSYDTTFSGDGRALAPCGTHIGAFLQADPQGRPVMMCVRKVGGLVDLRLIRFTTTGVLDPAYSGNGMASLILTGGSDQNWSLLIDPLGRAWGAAPRKDDPTKVLVHSLDTSGNPNAAFSGDGLATFRWSTKPELVGLTVSGNRLFISGFRAPSTLDIAALAI